MRREQQIQNTPNLTGKLLRRVQCRGYKNQIINHHTLDTDPLLNFKSQYRQLWNKSQV